MPKYIDNSEFREFLPLLRKKEALFFAITVLPCAGKREATTITTAAAATTTAATTKTTAAAAAASSRRGPRFLN